MNKKHIPLLFFVTLLFHSCTQKTQLDKVEFLIGTWKIEGRENYESWMKEGGRMTGESYKMIGEEKKVSESLEIKLEKNQIVYIATVFNQNQGKGIPFILNKENKERISFENMDHDFPNKIQYKMLSSTELQVSVLGKDGKGFSYKMRKY